MSSFWKTWNRQRADKMTVQAGEGVLEALAAAGHQDPAEALQDRITGYMRQGDSPTGHIQVWTDWTPGNGQPTDAQWDTMVAVDVHWDTQDESMTTVTAYLVHTGTPGN